MALNVEKIVTELEGATILELAELVKAIEEKFNVSAAAPVAAAGAAGAAAVEEKTSFDIVLTASGDKKVGVIKIVREITGLGLKEAKDLVDSLGTVKEGATKAEADDIKAKIEEAGGSVDVK